MVVQAEYIWLDGTSPTQQLRSKTKVLDVDRVKSLKDLPEWGFDGSSTNQAPGDKSDCALKPVSYYKDPIRGGDNVLVMCEVMLANGQPHPTNQRAALRAVAEKTAKSEPWFGIEQEYTLLDAQTERPLGWPEQGFPAPQGPYYCGVGSDKVYGRELVEAHTQACIDAGIRISGTNAEVMPSQWEFQVGPVGSLEVSDQLWVARWLLSRLGEELGIVVTIAPKPVKGDWNGTGAHTNFSTKEMRSPGGMKVIEAACGALEKAHAKHIAGYGAGNEERLTGKHETARIDQFRWGVSDRGASIRIPLATSKVGYGYLEDRRPAANMDPYVVTRLLLETVVLGADPKAVADVGTENGVDLKALAGSSTGIRRPTGGKAAY
ncbi:MAG: glutamine synthetase beta-grasp domain-containing protein [Halobacteriales archaeon]|nr:glutamine synthetase beta-grasp domain-containing protein [Halobacteriales archaeon]